MIKYDSYDKSVKVPIGLNFIDVLYLEGCLLYTSNRQLHI